MNASFLRTTFRSALLLLLAGASAIDTASAQTPPGFVELHGWFSPSRADNSATTSAAWQGASGQTRSPDYGFVRVHGYVFDPALPQPAGTVPMHSWFSPSRGDNLTTTQAAWRGASGQTRSPDYTWVRLEGFVFDPALPQPAGTVPLHSWFSPSRADNSITSDPAWVGASGQTRSPDYAWIRLEGYVYEYEGYTPFGPSCGRSGGPVLEGTVGRQPRAGRSYLVTLRNLPTGSAPPAFLLYDVARIRPPVDLGAVGMPGCLLQVAPALMLPFNTTSIGIGTCTFTVPNAPGFRIHQQAAVIDPLANAGGISLSNAASAYIRP